MTENDLKQLKIFTDVQRVDLETFRNLMKEGFTIPLHLEELLELRHVHTKLQDWQARVALGLAVPLT